MNNQYVFFYGTIKLGEPNNYYLSDNDHGRAEYCGQAQTVHRWPLVIVSKHNMPILLFKRHTGKRVMGDLYLLDDRMRARIDQLCSQPVWHMRMEVPIQVVNTGETMMVWAYFIPDFKPKLLTYDTLDNYTSVMAMLWGQEYDETSRVLENQLAKFKSLCCIKRCDCDRCRFNNND